MLTGGIAYAALFSLSAGLTLGWTVLVRVLGARADLRERVLTTVDQSLPGLLDTGDGRGLLDPDTLVMSTGLTVAGAVAAVVLVVSATSAMAAMRTGVRAMFDAQAESLVLGKLRELGGLVGVAVVVLLSAVLSTLVTGATQRLLGLLGVDDSRGLLLQGAALAVAFAVDMAVFVLVVVVLAGVRPARRDLLVGAVLAATGLGAVRLLGTSVVAGSVDRNALLGSFAVLITLLVWMNLVARIMLLAAAWVADPPAPDAAGAPVSDERAPTRDPAPDGDEPVPPRG
ncbi:YhjD/YihY/BrkB family envelope integrity protein [Cellulomonas soli]